MSDCRKCARVEICAVEEDCYEYVEKQMTNADSVRNMTDEELAEWSAKREMCFIYHLITDNPDIRGNKCRKYDNCKSCWLDWLKQEACDDQTDT